IPRVILISAGNVRDHGVGFEYPAQVELASVEDPAQAWNAVTVGSITNRTSITESDNEARRSDPVAPPWGVSPFSRTSHQWRPDWPIGPDIVMEGGNLARSQDGDCLHLDSLQPLSTASDFRLRPLVPFNATSASTAQAARVAALISSKYPDYRPETIRGLLVHSARWPDELLRREGIDPHAARNTGRVDRLMRSYGFGVVDERRALACLENQTTVVFESTIQPYTGKWNSPKLNECHLIALPWPKEVLSEHPDDDAILRVTLSYFIEPNPGSRTWEKSQKYHYASCLLRFRPKHRDQSLEDFRSRLDAESSTTDEKFSDPGWAVGGTLRGKTGSLVQDIWKGTTGQLAEMGHIGVFPAKGWWAYRTFKPGHELHGRHLRPVPYSLIVSLETKSALPIYSGVAQAIAEIESSTSISIDA
ncbi:MAG TPA: S8 family serine peptidase, partial [Bacteroidia bacterium]|nr:S8 family serine peptidase [Bacteroidia bacterium]